MGIAGTTTAGTSYMHEKNIVGVSVNCVNTSKKYDFNNSSLLSNNSYPASTAEVNLANSVTLGRDSF